MTSTLGPMAEATLKSVTKEKRKHVESQEQDEWHQVMQMQRMWDPASKHGPEHAASPLRGIVRCLSTSEALPGHRNPRDVGMSDSMENVYAYPRIHAVTDWIVDRIRAVWLVVRYGGLVMI